MSQVERAAMYRLGCVVLKIAMLMVVGCDDGGRAALNRLNGKTAVRNARLDQVLRNALTSSSNTEVHVWRAFLGQWPTAQQRKGYAWYEGEQEFRGEVSATALLEDRYIFRIILNFKIAQDFQRVTFTQVRFHVAEVKNVVVSLSGAAAGGVSISFQPGQNWFGLNEWKLLERSNWNFKAVGIDLITNSPIPNIRSAISGL